MIFAKLYQEHISETQLIKTLEGSEAIFYWSFILHDQDRFPSGELKKPHYHIIIDYDDTGKRGCKYFMNRLFTKEMLSGSDIQTVKKGVASHRYLLHMDNLEKFQYQKEMIKTNDKERLEEYLIPQIRLGKPDQALIELCNYVRENYVNNGVSITQEDIYNFCEQKGFLAYYINHTQYINIMLNTRFGTNFIVMRRY